MSIYAVTGGAGFIGSNIVDALVAAGHQVKVIDNFSTGFRENISPLKKQITLCKGDIRDLKFLKKVLPGVDYVLHHAAVRAVLRSVEDPTETNEVNVTGTLNVLTAARDARVKRVVFASSASIYGNNPELPKRETMLPEPISPYAASKIMGEYYAAIFHNLYGLETVSLRYFNVFGPRQNPESIYSAVIPIFVDCITQGKAPDIHGDGEQTRDFVYVHDVAAANILATQCPHAAGHVFNIASGTKCSVNHIFDTICKIIGKSITPRHTAPRLGDVRHVIADSTNARDVLGFQSKTVFEEGLRTTVEWFIRQHRR